jgi:hypothetical protein
VSEVRDWIRQGPFVTLLGLGGIGETTVAVAAGHDANVRPIAGLVHAPKAGDDPSNTIPVDSMSPDTT